MVLAGPTMPDYQVLFSIYMFNKFTCALENYIFATCCFVIVFEMHTTIMVIRLFFLKRTNLNTEMRWLAKNSFIEKSRLITVNFLP